LWPGWVEQDRRLAPAPRVDGLTDWLLSIDIDAADEVLHALVRIGSPSGGDCQAAVWVVVRALLPGAVQVARRCGEGPATDALVASQLWLEVRDFPWWRHRKVAGNVLANIRALLYRAGEDRPSWAEKRTVPTERIPDQPEQEDESPKERLADVMSWAEEVGIIGADEARMLSSLVAHTDRIGIRTVCRAGQGLMSARALAATGAELGVSGATIGRRARRSIDALAAACRSRRTALTPW
jgi:hypothetical protein